MTYETFKNKVNAIIEKAGGGIKVRFHHNEERGQHFANLSDGTTIVGNESCFRVSVRWNGRNHRSVACI